MTSNKEYEKKLFDEDYVDIFGELYTLLSKKKEFWKHFKTDIAFVIGTLREHNVLKDDIISLQRSIVFNELKVDFIVKDKQFTNLYRNIVFSKDIDKDKPMEVTINKILDFDLKKLKSFVRNFYLDNKYNILPKFDIEVENDLDLHRMFTSPENEEYVIDKIFLMLCHNIVNYSPIKINPLDIEKEIKNVFNNSCIRDSKLDILLETFYQYLFERRWMVLHTFPWIKWGDFIIPSKFSKEELEQHFKLDKEDESK